MDTSRGYRLKAGGVADLSRIVDDFRADALRILARKYGALVAARAVSDLDAVRLGLRAPEPDPFKGACAAVRRSMPRSSEGLPSPDLNCVVAFHFVRDAVLARFVHGHEDYRRSWESMRDVVRWGWLPDADKPKGVSEKDWESRRRFWEAASARPGFGSGMNFVLVEDSLPDLGWGGIRRHLPDYEARVASATALIEAAGRCTEQEIRNPSLLRNKAVKALDPEITKESFLPQPAPKALTARLPPPASDDAAGRLRKAARSARQERTKIRSGAASDPDRATSIDHADVIVSSDGRTFVAAPYVGLDPQSRVFLQVGDNHVAVSQGGVQYGYVTGVKKSAIDLLRLCKTVVLVEVAPKAGGGRLLRAKHVAIVSDISLSENLNISLGGFNHPRGGRGEREIREWESGQ